MSLNNIKKMQSERGFTIVELLIVIVVIGILAAIVIVAYQGVTNKANQSAAKGNAESVQKVVEAFNADKGYYPADKAAIDGATGLTAKMPGNVTVDATVPTGSSNADKNGSHVYYDGTNTGTSSTGGCIVYWDVVANAAVTIKAGDATGTITSGACS